MKYPGYSKELHNSYVRNFDNFLYDYEETNNNLYFSRNTLKFFGERLSEMRILKDLAEITEWGGEKHTCYILSSYQRNYPGGPRRKYSYFDINTLERISPASN